MAERFIQRAAQAILVEALATGCSPHARSEMVDQLGTKGRTPVAEAPDSLRNQAICGPGQRPLREYWSGVTGGGESLFEAAVEMGKAKIESQVASGQDHNTEATILRNHGDVIVGEEVFNFRELEILDVKNPSAVPTVGVGQEARLHVLFCGSIDPTEPIPQP